MIVVPKKWGFEEWCIMEDFYGLKKLFIKAFCSTSYHYHKIKDEAFYINKGEVLVKIDDIVYFLTLGDRIRIPPNTKHSVFAITNAEILEVSTSELDERVRLGEIDEF